MKKKHLDWLVVGSCAAIVLAWVFNVPIKGGDDTAHLAFIIGVFYLMFWSGD